MKENEQIVVFGLTYLEEEEAELADVVGCLVPVGQGGLTSTGCDDTDIGTPLPPGVEIP